MIHPARIPHLGALLEDAFLQYPSDVACIEVDRDREVERLSFAEVRGHVRRVAAWMQHAGVGPDVRVGIVMSNQSKWLIAASAILRLGGVIVPLDARLTVPEQQTLLQHARVHGLVGEAHTWRAMDLTLPMTLVVDDDAPARGATAWSTAAAFDGDAPVAERTREDLACIVYSSGTGGTPKGCMLPHRCYLAQYQSLTEVFTWRRGDRYFSILPTNHAIDFMCGFIAAWATGSTVIHQRALRPEFLVSTMRRYRVTQMAVVPLVLKAFDRALTERLDEAPASSRRVLDGLVGLHKRVTDGSPRHGLARWMLKPVHDAFGGHLRQIFCGGSFTEAELATRFTDLGLPVAIGYGLTEACTVATVNNLAPFRADTVGAAVPGVQVRIVDAGADGVGEVQIAGPTVFAGYLDAPELTAEAFEGPWLRTGDLGWFDAAHHLHLVGRRRNMIVTPGGKNVYPEDVESAFGGVDVDELCVLAADFVWPRTGLVDEELLLVVKAPIHERAAQLRALRRQNRALPEHKRVHRVLWWDDAFPRTASMKVKRDALASTLRERAARDQSEVLG